MNEELKKKDKRMNEELKKKDKRMNEELKGSQGCEECRGVMQKKFI